MRYITLALSLLTLLAAAPASRANDTRGFMLGLDVSSSHIDSAEPGVNEPAGSVFIDRTGSGAALVLGWGFTPSFALRLVVAGAQHDTTDPDTEFWLGSGTLEAQYLFRAGEEFRPYLIGGAGGFGMGSRQSNLDFEVNGPGVTLGGGFAYFVSDRFALDLALRGDFINWEEATATLTAPNGTQAVVATPIEEEGSAARVLFGLNWWFGKGERGD